VISLRQSLLRFFLPWACAGCRGALASPEDPGFCGQCWLAIPRIQGIICQECGIPLKNGGNVCYTCRQSRPPLLIRAATEYRSVVPPAIHRFKYAGRRTLVQSFGALLRYAWDHFPELHDIQGIIPVPLYPKNERIRGFNQAELLARHFAADIGRPMLPLLLRTRKTLSQIELNRSERRDNVRSAFALQALTEDKREILRGRSFLLMDDVCTTASTLGECAKVLYGAGIRTVKSLVLARDL